MNVDSDFAIRGGKQGYLEKLDYNVIKTNGVDKDFISPYGIESDNFPVAISYNTSKYSKSNHPKTLASGDSWVFPKGAPNKALAMKFINFATQAKQQAEFCKNIDYLPTNSNAYTLLPDDVKARLGKSADNTSAVQIKKNINWWATNYDAIEKNLNNGFLNKLFVWRNKNGKGKF